MKRSEWSDKQLEELLRKMPQIHDHRHPRDIYHNLSIKKRRLPIWLIPGLAAMAAVLLLFILVPKLSTVVHPSIDLTSQEKQNPEKTHAASISRTYNNSAVSFNKSSAKNKAISGAMPKVLMAQSEKTALYQEDAGDGKVLIYWIPDKQAHFLVPVSTVAKENADKSWLDLFKEKMAALKEKEWGLSDYYPLDATLKFDGNSNLIADVPKTNKYVQGSTSESTFINVLKKDVSTNSTLTKIELSTNGHVGIEFDNYGPLNQLPVEPDLQHGFFFYYPKESGIPFLVPSLKQFPDIISAFKAMEKDDLDGKLKASLGSFPFKNAEIKDGTLYISMGTNTDLTDDILSVHSFEAILLTAKDFGAKKVLVENSPLTQLGPFDLTREVSVPVAPNYRSFQ